MRKNTHAQLDGDGWLFTLITVVTLGFIAVFVFTPGGVDKTAESMELVGQSPIVYVVPVLTLVMLFGLIAWTVANVPYNHGGRL